MERLAIWWNVQRLLRPNGKPLARALNATEADGWTTATLAEKIERCAAVLRALSADRRPALVGLCEVADDDLAARLAKASKLGLEVVRDAASHLEGADLVLLIDPDTFDVAAPPVSHNIHNRFTTRDIYEVELRTKDGFPLVVIACHWPSRRISNSEPLRIAAADWSRRLVEKHLKFPVGSVINANGRARMPGRTKLVERASTPVLFLGDFNDSPFDVSLDQVFGCLRDPSRVLGSLTMPRGRDRDAADAYLAKRIRLLNPSWPLLVGTPPGSTYWESEWWLLDQVTCSPGLLTGSGIRWVDGSLKLHALRTVDVGGTAVPWCSRSDIPAPYDPKTHRGISDHLPLTFTLEIPEA